MEREIMMAAKLYKCRDSARFILGERYAAKMADYGKAISEVAARLKCNEISAATKMAGGTDDGMLQMLIFAAAVELAEPSNGELSRPARLNEMTRDREAGSA